MPTSRSPEATVEDLDALARSEYPFVVEYVSGNPRTRPTTLTALVPSSAGDGRAWHAHFVLRALLGNPSTPEPALRRAAELLMTRVREHTTGLPFSTIVALFRRPDAPDDMLLSLLQAADDRRELRRIIARETTHPAVRDALLRDRSGRVQRAAQRNTSAGPHPLTDG